MPFKNTGAGILASYLKHKRILAGLSQGEVAKTLGYSSAQFVSNWERGISSPPANIIPKVAELYSLSVQEFVLVLLKEQEAALWLLFGEPKAKARRSSRG
jgi:transcriptional regulator with XRE-family HTH domain